jgi:hypothetical protein
MNKHLSILFGLLTILPFNKAISQDELFYEISLEKIIVENEQWELVGEGNWKHLFNEPRWRRLGVSLFGVRKIKQFNLLGGVNGYYTFNRSIVNFFELRPWAALAYNVSLNSKIRLRQRLKAEWRLFYDEGEAPREDYSRIRYLLGVEIPITSRAGEALWRVRPYFEWYFIRNPSSFERFPNERDYGITFIKRFENHHELSFGYRLEEFYNVENEQGNGHLLLLGYSL